MLMLIEVDAEFLILARTLSKIILLIDGMISYNARSCDVSV